MCVELAFSNLNCTLNSSREAAATAATTTAAVYVCAGASLEPSYVGLTFVYLFCQFLSSFVRSLSFLKADKLTTTTAATTATATAFVFEFVRVFAFVIIQQLVCLIRRT